MAQEKTRNTGKICFIDWSRSSHKLLDTPVLDLDDVNSSAAVDSNAVRKIELARELSVMAEHAQYLPVQVQLENAIVLSIAHVDGVFAGYVIQAPGRSDIRPLSEKLAVLIEDLHAFVGTVGYVDAAGFVEHDIVNQVELSIARAFRAPMHQVLAIRGELDQAGIDIAVGDKEFAVLSECDIGRLVESVFAVVVTGGART